ncbi:Ubiquitin-conjugating enzyme E2 27 [Orobanche minor]
MVDFARVQKELQECNRDFNVSGIEVIPRSESNLVNLLGTIPGPLGTPYEGGTFKIDIVLPEVIWSGVLHITNTGDRVIALYVLNNNDGYPFEPPRMRFATKVWHPNISSQSGAICLDILKDQWSPALTLKTALLSVQALLSAPEPDDPQDAVVARQYLKENQTFVRTARYWTESFAITSSIGVEEKVQKLVEMGFPEASVRSALESVGGDENLALEKLCCG